MKAREAETPVGRDLSGVENVNSSKMESDRSPNDEYARRKRTGQTSKDSICQKRVYGSDRHQRSADTCRARIIIEAGERTRCPPMRNAKVVEGSDPRNRPILPGLSPLSRSDSPGDDVI